MVVQMSAVCIECGKETEATPPKVLQCPHHVELLFDKTFRQWEAQYLVFIAHQAVDRRQFESAHSAVARALALEPDDPETCDLLAWLLTTGRCPCAMRRSLCDWRERHARTTRVAVRHSPIHLVWLSIDPVV